MWLTTLFLATALADVRMPEASQIPTQGTADGALTTCDVDSRPMGRSLSGKPCADLKEEQARPIPPAPTQSMQKPGGWMPTDSPGSSP